MAFSALARRCRALARHCSDTLADAPLHIDEAMRRGPEKRRDLFYKRFERVTQT